MSTFFSTIQQKTRLPVWLLSVASILFFSAERYMTEGLAYKVVIGASALFAIIAIISSILSIASSKKSGWEGQARSLQFGLYWSVGYVFSFVLYLVYKSQMAQSLIPSTTMQKVLLAGWLVTLILSLFTGIGIELSMRESGYGRHADPRRIARSGAGWLLVGLILASLVGFNYSGASRDKVSDWTYLKTTEPGPATKSMLASLDSDVKVVLFYPADNEVLPQVQTYFQNIASEDARFKVEVKDKDLNPNEAEEYKVSRNGQIVLSRGEEKQRIDVGLEISKARNKLKTLDAEFQKAFLKLTADQKTVYFTSGHGEMTWLTGTDNPLRSLRIVEKILRDQNYRVRQLDVSKGLAIKIPEDASVVVIAGPTRSFLKAEVDALKEYVENGGKLMVLLDVDKDRDENLAGVQDGAGEDLLNFLKLAGVLFKDEMVANDGNYVSATKSPSDKWFLYSNNFTSHESVKSLAKHEENIPLLLYHVGHVVVKEKTGEWRAFPTVRSLRDSFVDANRNFQFDKEGESRKTYDLAAAVTYNTGKKNGEEPIEGRMIVAADAHIVADAVAGAGSPANLLFIMDGLKWLAGESKFAGETNSEEDVKIRHNRKENLIWFHSSVYGVPLFILLVGFIATRRRRVR